MDNDLLKFCQNATEREDFVGIYFDFDETLQTNRPYITFPYGYHFSANDDILYLIKVLSDYQNESQEFGLNLSNNHKNYGFPIYSYIFIIQDFLKNGYYYEWKVIYKRQNHGKINWGRTIKKERAIIQNNGAIYLTMQTKTHQYSDEYLMTQISQHCVYESFIKMGWFYSLSLPTKPNSKFNKALFIATLQDKLSKANKDLDKQLFQSMLNILNTMDEYQNHNQHFTFGTRRFEKVWEYLVDKAFGTEFGEQKVQYFPKASWQLNHQEKTKTTNSLYPDTIGINGNMIYIIDAKYYRYGITKNPLHLPNISSIAKQITYAEYISHHFRFDTIKNIFILPFNAQKNNLPNFSSIGFAVADWIDERLDYRNIDTLLVDTKYLMMKHHKQNQGYFLKYLANDKNH